MNLGYITRTMRKVIKDYIELKLTDRPFWYHQNIRGKLYKNLALAFAPMPQHYLDKKNTSIRGFGICLNRDSKAVQYFMTANKDLDKLIKKYKTAKYNLKNISIVNIDDTLKLADKIDKEIDFLYKKHLNHKRIDNISDDFI